MRATISGGTFFFTVVLLERHRQLLVENNDILRMAFRSVYRTAPAAIATAAPRHRTYFASPTFRFG